MPAKTAASSMPSTSVIAHLPARSDRAAIAVLAVLSVVGARVDLLSPMFDLDSSWAIGLNYLATHGARFGHDIVFTYGPLVYLTIPLSMYRVPMLLGLIWAIGVSAATQTALWILTRHLASRALRFTLMAAASLTASFIWRPELALMAFAVWILVLLDLNVIDHYIDPDDEPSSRISDQPRALTVWLASLGAVSAVMTLSKFSLLLTLGLLIVLCLSRPHSAARVKTALAGFVGAFLFIWLLTGQNLGDIPRWFELSLKISNGYNSEMSFFFPDPNSVSRLWSMLVAAIAMLAAIAWRPALAWYRERTRANAALPLVLAITFYFFLKQSFVRFDAMHASAVFGLLLVLAIAVGAHLPRPAWTYVVPGALVLGTVGAALPPVKGVDLWFSVRHRVESVKQVNDGVKQVFSSTYHDEKLARDWQRVMALGGIPVDVIRQRIGNATVSAEPAHISAVFASGLNWKPMFTMQAYSAFTPYFDNFNAARLADDKEAPQYLLARYSTIDNRNQLWTSPRYQLSIACNYVLDADLNPFRIFRRTTNMCSQPTQIGQITVKKNQPFATPSRPGSIVVATFSYSTGILDKLASQALRPYITPQVRIDDQRVRLISGVATQPHIIAQPLTANGRPLPWGGIAYKQMEFLNIPGDITVTFFEVPLTSG